MTVASPPGTIAHLWSQKLTGAPRGMSLAREKGWLLAWDANHWLYLFDANGHRQAQVCIPDATVAACADDGSALAAADRKGNIYWLAPDLSSRWNRTVPERVLALALDPFGQYLAASDAGGAVHFFDCLGRDVARADGPRALHYLAFIPSAPYLMGSSDFGLVACLDLAGRWAWRDGLVVHIGSLAVSGDGETVLLACFTEGLRRYTRTGKCTGRLTASEPCRLVCLSFDGGLVLASGMSNRVLVLDAKGRTLAQHPVDGPPAALALDALGDQAYAALPDGRIIALDLRRIG